MCKLRHPNIIPFFAAVYNDNNKILWIVSEFAPKGSLQNLLQKNRTHQFRLSEFRIVEYSKDILNGLSYIHNKMKGMHRDLKPGNILISADGTLKLCDFGLAKLNAEDVSNHTQVGTPKYIAPEIIKTKYYTNAVDVWSFGVVLLEMIVGVVWNMHQGLFQHEVHFALEKFPGMKDVIESSIQIEPSNRRNVNDLLNLLPKSKY